jgi:peptidoglycan-N-acetylglucosamine deacetylase
MKTLKIARLLMEFILIAGIIYLIVQRSGFTMKWFGVLHRVPTDKKIVALTYDDGPNVEFTPKLLKVLAKYHAKATFFMIGNLMEKHPDIVKEVVAQGHLIGNHTYSHPHDIELCTDAQIAYELDRCGQIIEDMTGKQPHLFRPPLGLADGRIITLAEDRGYTTVLWSVCADHHDAPTPESMANRVIRRVRPGSIILAHDGRFETRWRDVVATEIIIKALKKRGYRFVTVEELINEGKSYNIRHSKNKQNDSFLALKS